MTWAGKAGLVFLVLLFVVPAGAAWSGPLYNYMAENNKSKAWLAESVNGELGTGVDTGPELTTTSGVSTSSSHEITMYGRLFGIDTSGYPVKVDTTPKIWIQTSKNVDDVDIEFAWGGPTGTKYSHVAELDNVTNPFPFGEHWTGTLPSISDPGTRVSVTAIGRNYDSNNNLLDEKTINQTSQVTQFTELPQHDTPGPENYHQHHYYTFKDLINVTLITVKFQGQDLDNTFFTTNQSIRRWQKARQSDIASYYGSIRGLHGQTGINFKFTTTPYSQPQPLPEIGPRSSYTDDTTDTDRDEFFTDVENAVTFNTTKPYIATHPGPPFAGAVHDPNHTAIYANMLPNVSSNQNRVTEGHGYITWTHELGHHLGYIDLYNRNYGTGVYGGIDDEGIMADGAGRPCGIFKRNYLDCRIASPLTSVSKTQTQDAFLTEDISTRTDLQNNGNAIYLHTEALLNKSHGDSVHVIDTEEVANDTITDPGRHIYYNIEARGISRHEEIQFDEPRVKIYRKGTRQFLGGIVELRDLKEQVNGNDWIETSSEYIADTPSIDTDYFYNFSIANESGASMNYEAWITVNLTTPNSGSTLTTMTTTQTNSTTSSSTSNEWTPTTATTPDRDLLAIDTHGRIIGPHPKTDKYVNQIPGAASSGDRTRGMEWILIPTDINATFYVDTTDTSTLQTTNNLITTPTTITTTHYGNNTTLTTNGVTNITKTHQTLYPAADTYTSTTGNTITTATLLQ